MRAYPAGGKLLEVAALQSLTRASLIIRTSEMIVRANPNSVRDWGIITPDIKRTTSLAPQNASLPRRRGKMLYERALAARLKRIAGPPSRLAATIAVGLADRRRRTSATLNPSSIGL